MTYPSGRVITSGYDEAGRLAGVKDQSSGLYYAGAVSTDATNRIQYAAHGAVSVMKLGNGLWEHTNFNNRLQATQIGLGTSSTSSSTMGLTYGYGTTNNNGNVLSVSYSGGGLSYTQNFGYDQLNRLTTSTEGASWSQTNSYDRYGNRRRTTIAYTTYSPPSDVYEALSSIKVGIVELPISPIEGHDFEDIVLGFAESNLGRKDARVALI